jgi:uncharacterized protein
MGIKNHSWIIQQRWVSLVFLHSRVPAHLLQDHCPFELDLFEGHAIVSTVPFRMNSIRFPYTPTVPYLSKLNELNLRTYVKYKGQSGIYFFTLDSDSIIGTWIAQKFFHLPYRYGEILIQDDGIDYCVKSKVDQRGLKLTGKIGTGRVKTPLEQWALERYSLFATEGPRVYRGDVIHEPWKVKDFKLSEASGNFTSLIPVSINLSGAEASYSEALDVCFLPFQRCE